MKMNIAHINVFRKIDSNSLLYLWGSWWCLPFSSINQEVHRIRLTPRDWGKTCSLVDLHPAIDTHFLCVARGKQIPHHNQNYINIKLHQYSSINKKRGCTISDELPGSGSKIAVCMQLYSSVYFDVLMVESGQKRHINQRVSHLWYHMGLDKRRQKLDLNQRVGQKVQSACNFIGLWYWSSLIPLGPCIGMEHCQKHNGPEGWVLLTNVTSSYTNLDQISSSESRTGLNFKISTKHEHLD